MQTRRNFLIGTSTIIASPRNLFAETKIQKRKRDIGYGLQIVPDDVKDYDPAQAAKALAVAEYVLTTRDSRFHQYKDRMSDPKFDEILNHAEAVIIIDGVRYTVMVNSNKDRKILNPDYMAVYVRPNGSHEGGNLAYFGDDGLDAKVNTANLPARHPLNPTGKHIIFGDRDKVDAPTRQLVNGLNMQALDKIIKAYDIPVR